MADNNHIWICWVPAHRGVQGNEVADRVAREAAEGQLDEVPDQVRWQTSLPHLTGRTTERKTVATSQWIRDHARPERRDLPPGGTGFRRRAMRGVRKATAQRYFSCLWAMRRLDSSSTTGWPAPSDWTRISVGGAVAERDSRATTSSRSAGPGPPRLGRFGGGLERSVIGSIPGRRR